MQPQNSFIDKDFGASERHSRRQRAVILIPAVAGSNPAGDTMKTMFRKRLRALLCWCSVPSSTLASPRAYRGGPVGETG